MEQPAKPDQDKLRKIKLLKKVQNVKADQSPNVIKYFKRRKSIDELQTPVHDVQFNLPIKKQPRFLYKNFQKFTIDPFLQLDEGNEEKWVTLTGNYKSLIQRSKEQVNRETYSPPKPASIPRNIKFSTRRQSIEHRLKLIGTPTPNESPSQSPAKTNALQTPTSSFQDPYYSRFKKLYQKIGIVQEPQVKLAGMLQPQLQPRKTLKSQHSVMSHTTPANYKPIQIKLSQQSLYLREIQEISSMAQLFQVNFKKDQNANMNVANNQLHSIQADFSKFHQMLTTDLEQLEYIEEQK